jgi:hypothetical protein
MPTAAWSDLASGSGEPDWVSLSREYSKCKRTFILHVPSWEGYAPQQVLAWKSVRYDSHEEPEDLRGVYAFVLEANRHTPAPIPPFSLVLYVGETGETGDATLRSRLANYRNKKAQRSRARLYNMLDAWGASLIFYYAVVNPGVSTKSSEIELLDAILPPANDRDFTAIVSNARNAALDS